MVKITAHSELRLLRVAAWVPALIWVPLAQMASLVMALRPPRPLRQWEHNATIATGQAPGFAGRWAAQFSWIRNSITSVQLGRWSRRRILSTVRVDPGRLAQIQALHADRGLVLAAPHIGSWDLCGAYGTLVGLPVASVAERLPAGQFEYFRALRANLGMTIHPYDQPDLMATLIEDLRRGCVISLVADRDFGGRGLPVRWPTPDGGRDLTLPVGPPLIAQQSGAALVGIACHFAGRHLDITLSDEIAHRPGRDGAIRMAQGLVDFFAEQVSAKPTDWHLMQKFFPGEVV